MSERVSVVLPVYNGEKYLRESIESCLSLTYGDLELIVVDDHSTDATVDIVREYLSDRRVRVIRNEQTMKLPAALNKGFSQCTGRYLSWTSDDNYYDRMAMARMVSYLEANLDTSFVYSDHWIIDENGVVMGYGSQGPPETLRERCRIACFLYKREVYEAIGEYNEALFRIEDYDYWLRVWKRFRMDWIGEPLYFYRRHGSSLTQSEGLAERARREDALQRRHFGPERGRYSRILAGYCAAEAFDRHRRGDAAGVLQYAARAAARRPELLLNRGVLSIAAQAILGRAVSDRLGLGKRGGPGSAGRKETGEPAKG